jgi:ribosomal protein S18 acetylase RimI-like enzyme
MLVRQDNGVQYQFLKIPTAEQTQQIISLYREQGWWQASDDSQEQLLPRLISGSHCFVIATTGATVLGIGRAISDGVSDAYIQDVTVRKEYRNRGVGGGILRTLLNRLHDDGIPWIGLIAEPGSSNLYLRAGFHEMPGSIPMLMIREL